MVSERMWASEGFQQVLSTFLPHIPEAPSGILEEHREGQRVVMGRVRVCLSDFWVSVSVCLCLSVCLAHTCLWVSQRLEP